MTALHVPTRLIDVVRLADGRRVTLRPVLPQDDDLQQRLVRSLSPAARTQRFFAPIRELPADWLRRMTQVDHRRHVALVAESFDDDAPGRAATPVGEARYVVGERDDAAEFALVVADAWQRHGIGRRLLASLRDHAHAAGLARLEGEVQAGNAAMLALARRLGFELRAHPGDARLVQVVARLGAAPCPAKPATAAAPSAPSASAAA